MPDELNPYLQIKRAESRRQFFARSAFSLGAVALGNMLGRNLLADEPAAEKHPGPMAPKKSMLPSQIKNVIYLHMSGAPPTLDMLDWKPKLSELNMKPCPDELLKGQRFAFIKGVPKMLGSPYKFKQYGQSGTWVSEMMPHFSTIVDDVSVIHSMHTEEFNHAPAELFVHTGSRFAGNASMGSWVTYGLGSENQDLPGFVVLLSGGTDPTGGKSLWSSGFLPGVYQGTQCRSAGEPILYANNPGGMSRETRRRSLDALRALNEAELKEFGDPETLTRIEQYELAYRMQVSVPDVMDINKESKETLAAYGAQPGQATFANNCLLARRLVEKGVRFVQLYDWGWDIHGTSSGDDLITSLPRKCKEMDQPAAALIKDLKQRGLLDSTLVIWGGEFGRTPMNEERGGSKLLGRDHHPHCYSMWMAGGGVKKGFNFGETDELGFGVTKDKVSVRDLQATILHLCGLDPYKLSYKYQGLFQRLIGPSDEGKVRKELLA